MSGGVRWAGHHWKKKKDGMTVKLGPRLASERDSSISTILRLRDDLERRQVGDGQSGGLVRERESLPLLVISATRSRTRESSSHSS